jgi:hypothetical protein
MWMAAMWRNNAVMYVTVPYNKALFSILYFFLTSQLEVDFGIVYIYVVFVLVSCFGLLMEGLIKQ